MKEKYSETEFTKKVGNYLLAEQIGVGTFSKVTKGIHILTGEKVAIKILDKSKIKDEIDIKYITREIEILKSIFHKNICQLYESISTEHNFYLIMEYIEGGDLGDLVEKNISLSENLACRYFRQLISVIEYLNDMGITHRDLKPENILLDSSHRNIKVIDFGLSNYRANLEMLKSACGSPCFASPEMLSGKSYLGVTTDLWSAGIVLYSMLVGVLPFDDQELNALYEHIKIGTFYIPSSLSLESIDLLKKLLQVNPDKRITIEEIKKHIWFNIEKNILYKGIDLTLETFPYNEKLIDYIIQTFYKDDIDINKKNFVKMIQYHACNQYSTIYYLIENYMEKQENYKLGKNKPEKSESNNIHENKSQCNKTENSKTVENNRNKDLEQLNKKGLVTFLNNIGKTINYKKEIINKKIDNKRYEGKGQVISRNKKPIDKNIIKYNIIKLTSRKNKTKLSQKISTINQFSNVFPTSKNNYFMIKPKSWSKNKKYSNSNKPRNHGNLSNKFVNFKIRMIKDKFKTEIININPIKNNIENIKKKERSSNEKRDFSNSILKEKNICKKINSIKIEKQNKNNNNNITFHKNNNINYTINISKDNSTINQNKEKTILNITNKFPKISINKNKKKIYIKMDFNNKMNISQNKYFLTERNSNKLQYSDKNHSLMLMKSKYLENKTKKNPNMNNSYNKYKELLVEYNTGHSNKKKNKNKIIFDKEYFLENIKENQNKNISTNKYLTIINSSLNTSIINNTTMLNNKIDHNYLKNCVTLSLKNKVHQNIKMDKSKLNHKNINQKRLLNMSLIDNKFSNNNKTSKINTKSKKNYIKNDSKRNNLNYTSCIRSARANSNKKNKNKNPSKLKYKSPSPYDKNNYNKDIDDKKIINININNILKIKKKYSLRTKTNEDFLPLYLEKKRILNKISGNEG